MFLVLMAVLYVGGQMRHNPHVIQNLPAVVMDVRAQLCPVNNKKPQDNIVALRGNRMYHFCSNACVNAFNKEPQTYIRNLAFVREVALQTTNPKGRDPVSRRPIRNTRKPIFIIRGSTITFYASPATIGKDTPQALDRIGH